MGYNLRADWKNATSPLPQVTLRVDQFKEARAQAQNLMIKAQKSWVKHKDTPKYKEGDLVWLEGKNLRTAQPMPKLRVRRHGPFKVVQVMSPINYHLELPTQWSIHPVFHIDLLTPYRETIMHSANYQRPPPDLVDNAEEYEVEKILDSQLFGRRRHLQYLVKWKGYPNSDNMWVDKDDIFADDKVRAFKGSNPDARTHLRAIQSTTMPHSPLASSRSSSTSYFAACILSMSSNESNTKHSPSTGSITPSQSYVPHSDPTESAKIADAFRRLVLHSPTQLGREQAETIFEVSIPDTRVIGDENSSRVASRAAAAGPSTHGAAQRAASQEGSDSDDPNYEPDMQPCPRGCGPQHYCHGHTPSPRPRQSPAPVPIPPWPLPQYESTRAPIRQGRQSTLFAPDLASFRLTHEDAVALVDQLSSAIQQDDKDTDTVPPAYPAQGMVVRERRGRGQARAAGQPSDGGPRPPSYNTACGEQHRGPAPILIPEDFEINEGDRAILFTITDRFSRPTPARYIQVHMTSNPYVIAHLTTNGPDYRGELHAMPYNGTEPVDVLTDEAVWMLEPNFPAAEHVSDALRHIGDRTLWAEVIRFCAQIAEIDHIRVQQEELQCQCYLAGLELGFSCHRLQDARAVQRIIEDMVQDQRINQQQQARQRGRRGRGRPT